MEIDVTQLFHDHHEALCRYLFRFTGDADLAADAAQEAFVKAIERPPTTGYARAWLYAVATNAARDAARTRERRRRLLLLSPGRAPLGDTPPDAASALEARERRDAVQRALLALSERERSAILMLQEGFTQREIAEAIGSTTGSVGKLVSRTVAKLAERLTPGSMDLT